MNRARAEVIGPALGIALLVCSTSEPTQVI
jgi:hypothetical protein